MGYLVATNPWPGEMQAAALTGLAPRSRQGSTAWSGLQQDLQPQHSLQYNISENRAGGL